WMMIEAVTRENYEVFCKREVLTPNSAPNARIVENLKVWKAFGGWAMSPKEYLFFYTDAFSKLYSSTPASPIEYSARGFMGLPPDPGFSIPDCTGCNYGLGVTVEPLGPPRDSGHIGPVNLFHYGRIPFRWLGTLGMGSFAGWWPGRMRVFAVWEGALG